MTHKILLRNTILKRYPYHLYSHARSKKKLKVKREVLTRCYLQKSCEVKWSQALRQTENNYLASSIKSKTSRNFFAFQITINCLWASNNPSFQAFTPLVVPNKQTPMRGMPMMNTMSQSNENTYLKFSARRQAFVFESSPPITTIPSKSSFLAVSAACLNWEKTQQ